MAAEAFALVQCEASALPCWIRDCRNVEEARERGAKFVPWRLSDHISTMKIVRCLRLFLQVLKTHTYDAQTVEPEARKRHGLTEGELAEELCVSRRMVQYYIAEAERAGLIEVDRQPGLENVYRFSFWLLLQAKALFMPEPKPQPAPGPPPPPSIKPVKKSPGYWRLFLPQKPPSDDERRAYTEGFSQIREQLSKLGIPTTRSG